MVLEKTVESPLESKEIKPVNLKRNQPQILFGRIDAEAEDLIFWPPDANGWVWSGSGGQAMKGHHKSSVLDPTWRALSKGSNRVRSELET